MNREIIGWLVAVVLFIIIVLMSQCNRNITIFGGHTEYKSDTVSRIDSVLIPQLRVDTLRLKETPDPIRITDTDTLWRNNPIDTMAILADYYSTVFYQDTLEGKDYKLFVSDLISRNRIVGRSVFFEDYRPTLKVTEKTTITTPAKQRVKLFVGAGVESGTREVRFDVAPTLMLMTRKDLGIQVSYGVIGGNVRATILYKIRIKKPLSK